MNYYNPIHETRVTYLLPDFIRHLKIAPKLEPFNRYLVYELLAHAHLLSTEEERYVDIMHGLLYESLFDSGNYDNEYDELLHKTIDDVIYFIEAHKREIDNHFMYLIPVDEPVKENMHVYCNTNNDTSVWYYCPPT